MKRLVFFPFLYLFFVFSISAKGVFFSKGEPQMVRLVEKYLRVSPNEAKQIFSQIRVALQTDSSTQFCLDKRVFVRLLWLCRNKKLHTKSIVGVIAAANMYARAMRADGQPRKDIARATYMSMAKELRVVNGRSGERVMRRILRRLKNQVKQKRGHALLSADKRGYGMHNRYKNRLRRERKYGGRHGNGHGNGQKPKK